MNIRKIIPKDWDLVNLSDLTNLITKGTTPTTNGFSYLEEGVNFVKVESIHSNGNFIPSMFAHVGNDCHDSFKRSQLSEGDILFTIAGALGRSAIVTKEILPANTNQAVAIIRLKNFEYKEYIYHYLRGNHIKTLIEKINVSTAQANLSLGQINKFSIPLPPLPEQQKIADILSTVDAKIEVIDQQITETQALKKGLMQRLLTKGIGPTQFKDSPLGKIPVSWEVVKIGDLLEFKNGLNKGKEFFGIGIPIVNYMDVFRNNSLNLQMLKGRVDVDKSEKERFNVKKGDVFFTRTSETVEEIGFSACFTGDVDEAVFSGFILRARPINDKLDLYFKKYCFDSYLTRKEIISKSTYTTRALTNGTILSNVLILLPPKLEQQKIAEILSSVDDKLEVLEEKKTHYQALKQGLMQQLLTGNIRVKV
ncbi:restriction endonuclease subunit S [Mariniflexile gromovii]|uniref:Restriction endonuclease subunit S n=1 Tax=Mariniflexile gromovii TaxID=362523 RepID=A0ABS4BWI2_9FLAO|nr:restriction endonuclease subunit S [Mariniflexile gromovii]MBP0904956.1 restriction endonuclease subunit S [Mariniflexile gromovii]